IIFCLEESARNPQYAQPRPFACERIVPMPAIRVVALLAAAVAGSAVAQTPAWQDLSLPFERRAADLVGRMTLDEKVSPMMDRAPALDRLGIPEYNWWNEGLHGVARSGRDPSSGRLFRRGSCARPGRR